ncbi:MAG: pantoate kinase [Candidatus Hodarchaeota archaeon]
MPRDVSYWVAAHLTGIFEIRDSSDNLLEKGSRGAGLSINRGVRTTVHRTEVQETEILFNGIKKSLPETLVTKCVIDLMLPNNQSSSLLVHHNFEVPVSSGYGASAAGALGTAFCINDLFNMGRTELELFQVAHKAEVKTKSGLGDVIALYQGGIEIRSREGAPGVGKTMLINNNEGWKVATVNFGPLSTSEVLSNPHKRRLVNIAGSELVKKLLSRPTFSHFIQLAQIFTQKVKLWSPRLQKCIENLPNDIFWAQIMLGEGLFLFYQDESNLEQIRLPLSQINKETVCHQTVVKKQ